MLIRRQFTNVRGVREPFFYFFLNSRIREYPNTRNALHILAKHREIAKGVQKREFVNPRNPRIFVNSRSRAHIREFARTPLYRPYIKLQVREFVNADLCICVNIREIIGFSIRSRKSYTRFPARRFANSRISRAASRTFVNS